MEDKDLSVSLARFATTFTDVMADKRGVPSIVGFLLVLLNFCCQFFPAAGWFADNNALLHLGVLLAIGGSLLSSVL